jgi:hypothetical protein
MGHERIGALPLTSRRWRAIVQGIAAAPEGDRDRVASLATQTLTNVTSRFSRLHKDRGIQAAFAFLVSLATNNLPRHAGLTSPDFDLGQDPPPVRIAQGLNDWVRIHADSLEYAGLASRAGGATIAEWTRREGQQKDLFDGDLSAAAIWDRAANAAGFCELARSFFAHFMRRYLQYFLDREASVAATSLDGRDAFQRNLAVHAKDLVRRVFETSTGPQSFAAGWYHKYARGARPTDREIEKFLSLAFGKLREELRKEAVR